MKQYLLRSKNHKDVSEFAFNAGEIARLQWEDEHEFKLNGEMYDVIEKRKEGDKTIIRCIADKKETALLEAYQKAAQKNDTSKNTSSALLKLMTTAFYQTPSITLSPISNFSSKPIVFYSSSLLSRFRKITTPPPQPC